MRCILARVGALPNDAWIMTHGHNWIETERTRLRPFEEADAEVAFAWFSDPEVMRFIPNGPDKSLEETRNRIANYRKHQDCFGYSKWVIILRESDRAIGDSGLWHLPRTLNRPATETEFRHPHALPKPQLGNEGVLRIELGFRLAKPYWGLGLAEEVARGWMQWVDAQLPPGTPLFSDVHPEHARSQRVLERLGFEASHREEVMGMEMVIWRRGGSGGVTG